MNHLFLRAQFLRPSLRTRGLLASACAPCQESDTKKKRRQRRANHKYHTLHFFLLALHPILISRTMFLWNCPCFMFLARTPPIPAAGTDRAVIASELSEPVEDPQEVRQAWVRLAVEIELAVKLH